MALNDDDMEAMVSLLQNKTHMGRFNSAEVRSVLVFLEEQGYLVDPNAPEIVTVTAAELERVEMPGEPGNEDYSDYSPTALNAAMRDYMAEHATGFATAEKPTEEQPLNV